MAVKPRKIEKYNSDMYSNIKKLMSEKKYKKALKFAKEYMETYPDDEYIIPVLTELFMLVGDTESANDLLKMLGVDAEKYYFSAIIRMRMGLYEGKYEKVIVDHNQNKFCADSLILSYKMLKFLISYKNNEFDADISKYPYLSYTEQQIINYDEQRLKEHCEKHFNFCSDDKGEFIFNNVSFAELYNEVKNNLDKSYMNILFFFGDCFIFKKRCIGIRKNGSTTDYFKVFTIPNTFQVVTMFPVDSEEVLDNFKVFDLEENYLKGEQIVRKLSKVDKFNQRLLYKK